MFLVDVAIDAFSVFIIMLPLMILFPKYMKKQKVITSIHHSIGVIFYVIVIAGILSVNGIPSLLHIQFSPSFNFVPFQNIADNYFSYIQSGVGFILLGLLLPLLWKSNRSLKNTILWGLVFSLFIETMQMFCARVTDVNDLIFDILGLILGYIIFAFIYHMNRELLECTFLRFRNRKHTSICIRYEFILYMIVIYIVMFCVQSTISNFVWRILYSIILV